MRRAAAALIAVSLLATGCAVDIGVSARASEPIATSPGSTSTVPAPSTSDPEEPGGPTAAPPTTPQPPSPDTSAPSSVGPAPFIDLGGRTLADVVDLGGDKPERDHDDMVAATLLDLEAWLAEIHPQLHGVPWEPLSGGVYPAYPGRSPVPGCGEPVTEYPDIAEYIAFYCTEGDFIAYDDGDNSVLTALAAEFGPSVVGVVLAHEYGHVVQQRTGDLRRGLPTVLTEQQADCFAGAWVARAVAGDSPFVGLSDADVRGALITMVAVRDPVGTDQFAVDGHGTAFDRVGAFQEGYRSGPGRCAELLDDPLPLMPNQFQSLADARNDGDLPFGYGDGQIVPLAVATLEAYWTHQLSLLDPLRAWPGLRLVPVLGIGDATCATALVGAAPGVALCRSDGTVFLDDGIARAVYDDPIVGRADFAVVYLLALGWSEAAQHLLGSALSGADRAMANDCLVGAYTWELDPARPPRDGEGSRAGTISPGDLDEAVVAAIELGDDHADDALLGVPFDKIDAFRTGVLGGIDACLELIEP